MLTANVQLSQQRVDHSYQSATGQSAIAAGHGFNITVKGNPDLKGGALISTAAADRNTLTTASLDPPGTAPRQRRSMPMQTGDRPQSNHSSTAH